MQIKSNIYVHTIYFHNSKRVYSKTFRRRIFSRTADNMRFKNVVLILCAIQAYEGFLLGIEKSFDLSKFRGPVPTDKDVYRNVVSYELCLTVYPPFGFEESDLARQNAIRH